MGVVNWQVEVPQTDDILEAEDKSSCYFSYRGMEKGKLEAFQQLPLYCVISMGYELLHLLFFLFCHKKKNTVNFQYNVRN